MGNFEEVTITDELSGTSYKIDALKFDCLEPEFIKAAKEAKLSSKETSFLKNLSNYGFKKFDKTGNVKRYYSELFQPGSIDKIKLIELCKNANKPQNDKKKVVHKRRHDSGNSTASPVIPLPTLVPA